MKRKVKYQEDTDFVDESELNSPEKSKTQYKFNLLPKK
jgi:hypothetical protein